MKTNYVRLVAIIAVLILLPFLNVSARKVVITVQNFSFAPVAISDVVVGDTVHWDWISGSHTTTSTSVPAGAATWDNPLNTTHTSFEYLVTVAGDYNYKCTPHAISMGMVASFTAIDPSAITDKTSVFGDLQLSPNPASESVKLIFSPATSFKGSVRLSNLIGNTLWKSASEFNAGPNRLEINLANIPKGLYFIELRDNRNNRLVKRLIVQ
jgi:plastocyanin